MYKALFKKDFYMIRDDLTTFVLQLTFISFIVTLNLGYTGYIAAVIGGIWHYLMTVTSKDKKSGIYGLLNASPISVKSIINSRYIFTGLLFICITLFYILLSKVLRFMGIFPTITPGQIIICLFSTVLFISIMIPLYFALTDSLVRWLAAVFVPFFLIAWTALFQKLPILTGLTASPGLPGHLHWILLGSALPVLLISRFITLMLFQKMEY